MWHWRLYCPYCNAKLMQGEGYDELPKVWIHYFRCPICYGLIEVNGSNEYLYMPPDKRLKLHRSFLNIKAIKASLDRTNNVEYRKFLKQQGEILYPVTEDDKRKFNKINWDDYMQPFAQSSAEANEFLYSWGVLIENYKLDPKTNKIKQEIIDTNLKNYKITKKAILIGSILGIFVGLMVACAMDFESVGVFVGLLSGFVTYFGMARLTDFIYRYTDNNQSTTHTKSNTIQQNFQQNKHISTESYIFCEKCGHKIYASEKSCQNCGYTPNRSSAITETQPQPEIENIKQVENSQSVNSISTRNIPFTICPQCQSKIYNDEKNCLHCGYIVKQDNTYTTENFTNVDKSVKYTGNIDSIQQQINTKEPTLSSSNINNRDKSKSIELFNSKGYDLKNSNTNFASLSTKYMGYWMNPDPLQLSKNWYIVLNDCRNKKLYLFNIPKNAIAPQQLKHRKNSKLQILIRENDLKFEDIHSGFCFLPYLKDTLEYDKIT